MSLFGRDFADVRFYRGDPRSDRGSNLNPLPRDARALGPVVGMRRAINPDRLLHGTPPAPAGRECLACDTILSRWNRGAICGACTAADRDNWPPLFYDGAAVDETVVVGTRRRARETVGGWAGQLSRRVA